MGATKCVILFDDDENIGIVMKYALEEKGWEVICVKDSNDVVEQVRKFEPALIIMDNHIPDYGGVVATQKIKNEPGLKHIPVIFCTGSQNAQRLAMEAGADDYLMKPFDLVTLYELIDKLLPVGN
ncbi:MAG: response regulator [Mucilaginibacter sp.]